MRIEIGCKDRVGIAQEVLEIFVEREIDLRGIELKKPGQIFVNIPDLAFTELQSFMPQLRLIEGVEDVKTIAFMPSEKERNELATLIKSFPEPFISIDIKGHITMINIETANIMNCEEQDVIGLPIGQWLKGFNFFKWLEAVEVLAQTRRLSFLDKDYLADMMPVQVTDNTGEAVLAGAVLILKSEARLGQQVSAFKQYAINSFSHILATSSAMKRVIREAKQMSYLDSPIIIFGETGTGKELLARACHKASSRSKNKFMTLNCAALPDEVAESELFGYGSVGCSEFKKGLFELAAGGTLFLDEVSEMSCKLQNKLFRVIENGYFRRVNDEQEIYVDVRVVSATNKDLLELVNQGTFREDLYYRLNVLTLSIPPLRDRKQDITPLIEHFINKYCQAQSKPKVILSHECKQFIEYYPWPGNVRQVQNVILRAISLIEGNILQKEHLDLPEYSKELGYLEEDFEGSLDDAIKAYEANILRKLYPAYPSTRQLAKRLGISHTAVANKLRDYNINKKTVKSG